MKEAQLREDPVEKKASMSQRVYDRMADSYDPLMTMYRYAPAVREIVGNALDRVPHQGKVLDMGCGTGFALEAVAARRPDVELTGLDLTPGMLDICRNKIPTAKLILGDFNKVDGYRAFSNGEPAGLDEDYDLIISTGAVSEYADLEATLPLLRDHLRPGGTFLNIGIGRNPVNLISGMLWRFRPRGSRDFMTACERAGFQKVTRQTIRWRWFPTNVLKYAVSARKPDA